MTLEPIACPELSTSGKDSTRTIERMQLLLRFAKSICDCQSLVEIQSTMRETISQVWPGCLGVLFLKEGSYPWEAVTADFQDCEPDLLSLLLSLNVLPVNHWLALRGGLLPQGSSEMPVEPFAHDSGKIMVQRVTNTETESCLVAVCAAGGALFRAPDREILCHLSEVLKAAIHRCLAEERLERSEEYLQRALRQLPAVLWMTDLNLIVTHCVGKGFDEMLTDGHGFRKGVHLHEVLGDSLIFPVAHHAHLQALEGHSASYEYEWNERHYQCQVQPIMGRHQTITGVIGLANDITEWKNAELRLHKEAYYDNLTGLPNRALCFDWLDRALQPETVAESEGFALLYLDLDRFKNVNDSLGHAAGDELLKLVANRVRRKVKAADIVARIGGDEFAVLLPRTRNVDAAMAVAERIVAELDRPFNVNGTTIYCGVSIGVAMSRTGHKTPNDVLQDADLSMYQAKQSGRGRFRLFDEGMHSRVVTYVRLETQLRQALAADQFMVYYQPIVSLRTGHLAGLEALLRWNHPDGHILAPGGFIEIAEDTGLVVPIGMSVLETSCLQMRQWQEEGIVPAEASISVNISARHFREEDLLPGVASILSKSGLSPHCLRLEITESTVMQNAESTTAMLLQLRALNVQMNIDDFGTGYSSLSYLTRYPIDALKIDQSFVADLETREDSGEIVRTIINMARNLRMESVAEGIENLDQVTILREMGCELGQGYFFLHPVSAHELPALLPKTFQVAVV